ncbi:unnamed protein product [Absidia cylindrospora]
MALHTSDVRTTTMDSFETTPRTPVSTPISTTMRLPTTPRTTNSSKKELSSILRHRLCVTGQFNIPEAVRNSNSKQAASLLDYSYSSNGFYNCNICFDTAIYPVLTVCGHLFCWVCLSRWIDQQKMNPTCPMCKAGCPKDKIIPVYGRGQEEIDPRCDATIPSRPTGRRPEALRDPNVAGNSFFYPFSTNRPMDGHSIFISDSRPSLNQENQSTGFLSRLMLMILSLFIVVIVFY